MTVTMDSGVIDINKELVLRGCPSHLNGAEANRGGRRHSLFDSQSQS